jgi:hypothetical protein
MKLSTPNCLGHKMNITNQDSLKLEQNMTAVRADGTAPKRSTVKAEKPAETSASQRLLDFITQPLHPLRLSQKLKVPEVDLSYMSSARRQSQAEPSNIAKLKIAATLRLSPDELNKLYELCATTGDVTLQGEDANDATATPDTITDCTAAGTNESDTLEEEGAAYFHAVATICSRIASNLLTIGERHPDLLAEVNISALLSKIAQFKEMDVPQDEYAVDLLSAYCADLIDFATSGSAFQKLLILESVYPVLRDSSKFSFLAKSPLARYYLANIYLDNENKILRESSLSYIQRTYVVQTLSYQSQGLTVAVEEAAPWWDASISAEPSPALPKAKKGSPASNVLVPEFVTRFDVLKRLKLENAPGVKASEAVKALQAQTTHFLTAHAEIFSIAYRLTELMGAESTWSDVSEKSTTPCDVRDRCMPERSLAYAHRLQEKLLLIKQSGQVTVALESQLTALKAKLLDLDAKAKKQDEVADLVAYLIRHDVDIRLVNKDLRRLHVQADATLAEIKRLEIIASLLADEDAEQATQGAKTARKAAKRKNQRKAKTAQPSHLVPSVPPVPLATELPVTVAADIVQYSNKVEVSATLSLTMPKDVEFLPPLMPKQIPSATPRWQTALNKVSAAASGPSSAAVYELFTQVTGDPELYRTPAAEKCQIEGQTFWTRLPTPVLRAMLIPFVEPGSFGRAEEVGTNQVLGAARSLHYHYDRHMVNKAIFWPLGAQTPVEDYLDTALSFGSRVQRAIRKTSTVRPSEAVWKKYDPKYFGLFSQDNKLISFGPKGSFMRKAILSMRRPDTAPVQQLTPPRVASFTAHR